MNNEVYEAWKEIDGYNGKYLISNRGHVYNMDRKKMLKQSLSTSGYYYVSLYNNGVKKARFVHSLVAEHFIPNPMGLKTVRHINGDFLDNDVSNLTWRNGARKAIDCYSDNGVLIKTYNSMLEAVRDGYTPSSIYCCCRKKQKTHKGFIWRYHNETHGNKFLKLT